MFRLTMSHIHMYVLLISHSPPYIICPSKFLQFHDKGKLKVSDQNAYMHANTTSTGMILA